MVFTKEDYAELLGLYLGDGHIVRTGRSDRLRLFLDTRYEGITADAQALLERCFPRPQGRTFPQPEGHHDDSQRVLHALGMSSHYTVRV